MKKLSIHFSFIHSKYLLHSSQIKQGVDFIILMKTLISVAYEQQSLGKDSVTVQLCNFCDY